MDGQAAAEDDKEAAAALREDTRPGQDRQNAHGKGYADYDRDTANARDLAAVHFASVDAIEETRMPRPLSHDVREYDR
jgi:hypothetical protein